MRKLLLSFALLPLLSEPTLALQGGDACSIAQAIGGAGTFNYDCTTATAGLFGQGNSLCDFAGTPLIESDVWFDWTSNFTGLAVVTTCTGTLDDTKLAAYAGSGCPANNTALACNASACGLQSTIYFSAVSGSNYLIQLGASPGAAPTAPGTFIIREDVPVQYPVNGHHYLPVQEISPWDIAKANAEAITYLGVQGHLVTLSDQAEDQWVYHSLTGGPFGNSWIGLFQDFNDPNFSEPSGGWVWVDGSPFTYINWEPSSPNNGGSLEHFGGYWPSDQWNDYQIADANAARYVVEFDTDPSVSFCYGDGTGTNCPCGNPGALGAGCANSTGAGALLSTQGGASVVSQSFVLSATGMPANQLGLFFQGNNAINSGFGVSFGDGLRCAGGGAKRLQIVNTDNTGSTLTTVDVALKGGVVAGDLRHYQLFYSDPNSPCGALFNLSNATEVTWQP